MTAEFKNHPSKDQLLALSLGKLTPDDAEQIADHIDSCHDCSKTIVNLQDDTFVSLVRSSPAPAPVDEAQLEASGSQAAQHDVTVDVASGLSGDDKGPPVELPAELRNHPRYEILELIGRGGMGDVYKAQHKVMNRIVALKVIKPQLVQSDAAVRRFRCEVRAAARLHHGNIVTAYDAEQAGDLHYLVMEFVDGENLDEVIRQRGPLPVEEACENVRQAAEGLQYAHQLGMVHRDIKPHNLMIEKQSGTIIGSATVVKILDFGLASFANEVAEEELTVHSNRIHAAEEPDRSGHYERAYERAASRLQQLTQMGTMMGTPDYMAPEQAQDAHVADIRADIYSLGCTFYTLLTGKPPFSEGSVLDKIKAHTEQDPAPLSEFRDDVPAEVEAILLKTMAKDPAARYQTPQEVVDALRNFIDQRIDERLRDYEAGRPPGRPFGPATGESGEEIRKWYGRVADVMLSAGLINIVTALTFACIIAWLATIGENYREFSSRWVTILSLVSFVPGVLLLTVVGSVRRMQSYGKLLFAVFLCMLPTPGAILGIPMGCVALFHLLSADCRRPLGAPPKPSWTEVFVFVALLLCPFALATAGMVFYIQTDYGTVRVEVLDDSLKVELAEETITVKDGKKQLTLRPGPKQIVVRQNGSDFEFETSEFQIRRGGEIVLRVDLLPGEVVVSKDGERFGAKRLPDVTSSEYFQRLAGEPLESAVRERVGGAPGRKVTAERIPQPAGKIRYEARIDGVGGKIIEHVFVDLKDVLMRGTDARLIHHGERGNDLRLLRYTTPARNGEVRVTLTSRELGGQPADESTKWLLKVEASEWAKGEGKGTPSLVRVERDGGRLQLYLDGAPLSRDEVLVRLDALAKGDPGFQVHVEGDVVPPDQPHVMELMKAIGRTAVGDQNVKFPSHITQQIMENAKNEVRLIFDQRGANPGVEQVLEIPGVLTTRDSAEMMRRIEAMVAENPRLVVVLDIGDGVNPGHMPTIDVLRRHLAATGASVKDGPRLAAIARRQREVVENAVLRTKRMNDLKQVGLALHGFHDTRKFFPPGAVEHNPRWFGENGSPKLSWRVHLLPYLEQKALYDKFHLDEPWDSEHNKALLDQMPPQFKTTDDPTKTTFLAVVGEETAYEGKAGLTMDEIDEGDGRDNTAYVVDAGRERAVPWTKPEDLPFDKEDPIRAFGTSDFGNEFLAVMADGAVKSIPYDTAPESLRALFTRAAGDTFDETAKRTTPLPKNVGPHKLSPPAEITLDATLEGADDSLSRVVYSRDGRHVLAASGTQVFRWETASGELVNTYQLGDKKLDVIAVTGNPNHLVTTDRGYRVRLWDLTTEKVVQEFEPHEDLTIALAVSPDDRFVLSGCDGGVVRLSDLATGKKLHQSTGGFCRVVSFSADGTRIAVGSQFHVMVMDVESWTKLKDFRVTRTASARAAELSPDGRMTVTGTDSGSVMLWDVATGKQVHLASLPAPVRSCAFLPDGRHFVAGCEDKTLRVWNTQSGEEKFKVTAENHTTHWLAVSPDGKMIATGGGQFLANPDFFKYEFDGDTNVYLWQLPESVWPEVRADDISLERKFGGRVPVKTLAFLPNGDALTAAGGTVPELHVWDLKAGRVEVAIPIPFDIRTAAVSADLKFFLVAENNKGQGTHRVARYDLDVFTLPPDEFSKQAEKVWVQSLIPPNRKSYEILQVKLEPAWTINLEQAPDELTCFHNGDAFLVRDPRGRVALYRSEDGGFVSELAAENAEAMSLAPDGRLLFLKFKQGAAHLIRADDGSKVNELKIAPTSRVTSSCWCADGRCVVTGDASGRIQVWNLATGEPVHSFPTGDDPIVNVLIDTGRQRIYSSNHRGVSVWDLNGRLLARGEAPTFQEGSLALSPDGKLLLSGGQSWTNDGSAGKGDHSLRLWQLPESVWPQE